MRPSSWHSLVLVIASCCAGLGLSSAATESINWSAQWVGPGNAASNSWICFRKVVSLPKVSSSVRARIAVDSKYWLWLNGKLVVFEGGLKRGPTPQGTYYDVVEIGPELKKGDNAIAVLVWYWGKSGFSHNSSGKAALLFEADVQGQKVVSDATWKTTVHPAYEPSAAPHPNYRLSEFNVCFDARKDLASWTAVHYNDTSWPLAATFGLPPVAPWNQLEQRPILPWKNSGLLPYDRLTRTNLPDGRQLIAARLPYNAQVTPYLKVRAPAGQRIDIQTDNYLGGGHPNVRAAYTTRDGLQEYESLGWMNGHEVQYRVPPQVKVLGVKYRETGYNADFVGDFHCDDEALNTLWQKARRTLYVTMRDNYMDCPDRERAQWWGDMVNELGEAFYVFDAVKGPMLARKGIRELARWQRPDHTLYAPVPAGKPADDMRKDLRDGNWNNELPPQMLASVGKYGFWTYYWHTADRQTILEVYPAVRNYLKIWQLNDDGLVVHRAGDWDWEDWGKNIDAEVMDNAWYELALQAAIAMARLSGQLADIPEWEARHAAIARNFNRKFWTGKEYRSPAYQGDTDDRANALSVVAGLAEVDKYQAIRKVLAEHHNASPYMEKYVLEALYLMNAPDQAMARMKERWNDQIQSPITTLWEGWGIGEKGYGGGTYNHAWSGGALTVLTQYAAGVAPEEAGFGKFHVLPHMGDLKNIRAVIPTPHGSLRLAEIRRPGVFEMTLEVPPGTTGFIGIPKDSGEEPERVEINGKLAWKRDVGTWSKTKCAFAGEDERYIRFMAGPGKWHFRSLNK
jgi:hypothetical protein